MIYSCCKCWYVFLQGFCLTTTGPQSKGTRLDGVSCGRGLLTTNVLLLPLHKSPQVWSCYKPEKLCTFSLRCLPHILKRSCPCKLWFNTAPGPGGCTGHAGAGDILWGPSGIQPGEMHCAAGDLNWNMGEVGGHHAGCDEEPVQRGSI